jgi:hypothetical protein
VTPFPAARRRRPHRSDIPLIVWPGGRAERELCRAEGRPCILVIGPGEPPPPDWDELEDWVRAPVNPVEVATRQSTLRHRHRELTHGISLEAGLLRRDEAWTTVSPLQEAVLRPLLTPIGAIVGRRALRAAHERAGGLPSERAFDQLMTRLQTNVRRVGIRVRRVRGGRFLLEVLEVPSSPARTDDEMLL